LNAELARCQVATVSTRSFILFFLYVLERSASTNYGTDAPLVQFYRSQLLVILLQHWLQHTCSVVLEARVQVCPGAELYYNHGIESYAGRDVEGAYVTEET